MLQKFCLIALLIGCVMLSGCRKEAPPVPATASGPALVRLGPLIGTSSATVASHITIGADAFEPYAGRGWIFSKGLISAVESPAVFLIPNPKRLQEWKLKFRGRSNGVPTRTLRILAQGKEIASFTLTDAWQDYQLSV